MIASTQRRLLAAVYMGLHLGMVARAVGSQSAIRIVNPAEGMIYTFPSVVRIEALVALPSNNVSRVAFQSMGTNIGTVMQSPFILWLTNYFQIGGHIVNAIVEDVGGTRTQSSPVNFSVTQDPGPPIVTLLNLTNGQVFNAFSEIPVLVQVDFTDDSGNGVQLFVDSQEVALSTVSPHTFRIPGQASGEYAISARATNNFGNIGMSATVRVRVFHLQLNEPMLTNGLFQFQIVGPPTGQLYGVEFSSNLLDWTLSFTNRASSQPEWFSEPLTNPSAARFYRALALPE